MAVWHKSKLPQISCGLHGGISSSRVGLGRDKVVELGDCRGPSPGGHRNSVFWSAKGVQWVLLWGHDDDGEERKHRKAPHMSPRCMCLS